MPSFRPYFRAWADKSVPVVMPSGKLHVLVTGGAGFIGSHASLELLQQGHTVTVIDNLSRGNLGALRVLESAAPDRYHFHKVDLGDKQGLRRVLTTARPPIDLVMHFAAVAYVGESMKEPLRYYRNCTANTLTLLEVMQEASINKLIFSSTCATYGTPSKLPVTEETPTKPINPYGSAKLMAERAIKDFARANPSFTAILLRYFNVYGSDPSGRLGEYPRPELREHARISGACLDAALGLIPSIKILGTQHPTRDGTCIRDFIHVTDLVEAHVLAIGHLSNPPSLYNIATGVGISVREFLDTCRKVTGKDIQVVEQEEARPGDLPAIWADPSKINRDFNWYAKYTNVTEGLSHAWAWRSTHPHGY